ncbi:MAG: TRAP transporter large permease [Deltaproteobacteria bacterium]|nr:TRAP transporter large permease [Deltaproteobacteria bacterium]
MDPLLVGIIGVVVLIIGFFTGIPVAFVMALVGFAGFSYLNSLEAAYSRLVMDLWDVFSGYNLTVIPMFILMGSLAFYSGASSRLYNAAYTIFGRMRGGLGIATMMACGAFGAMSGSGAAAEATMSRVALPEMRKRGYDPRLATGCIAAGGPLAVLIPPSAGAIIYCVLIGASISHQFIAGILPGLMKMIMHSMTVYIRCLLKPHYGPPGEATTIKQKLRSIWGVTEMALLFILVMGGLFMGVFTPTEAGAIGAVGALGIALVRRGLVWRGFIGALGDAVRISTMLFIIVAGAHTFSHFITITGFSVAIQEWLQGLQVSPIVVIYLISLVFIMGGFFIEVIALVVLLVPIFYPVISALGFDPVWFGVLILLLGNIGTKTPPVGIAAYIIHGVAKDIPLETIFRGIIPHVMTDFVGIIIIIHIPQIVTVLPNMMS